MLSQRRKEISSHEDSAALYLEHSRVTYVPLPFWKMEARIRIWSCVYGQSLRRVGRTLDGTLILHETARF